MHFVRRTYVVRSRTLVVLIGLVDVHEGQRQWDDGGHDENDERHVLGRFPDELEERLGRLWRDDVGPEHVQPSPGVGRRTRQTYVTSVGQSYIVLLSKMAAQVMDWRENTNYVK